jgi:hypothetical protein
MKNKHTYKEQTCAEIHFYNEKSSHDFDFFRFFQKSQSHDFDLT